LPILKRKSPVGAKSTPTRNRIIMYQKVLPNFKDLQNYTSKLLSYL
jgi:hypothetical protein